MGEFAEGVRNEMREKLETAMRFNDEYYALLEPPKEPVIRLSMDDALDDLRRYAQSPPSGPTDRSSQRTDQDANQSE